MLKTYDLNYFREWYSDFFSAVVMLKAHTLFFGFVMNKHDGIRSKFKHVK